MTLMQNNIFKYAPAAMALLAMSSCGQPKERPPQKPNIIYILADDLGYGDLSCYGQEKFQTPNIDQLAAEGIRFTSHYSGSTVCAPSRCSLLTGLHTGHAPVRGNREIQPEGQQPMPADTRTLAHELKDAGYNTACIGKWGLGYPGSVSDPLKMGFDYFFGYNCQRHAHHYFVDYLWENDRKIEYPEKVYSHDVQTEKAFDYIRSQQDSTFFLYLAYTIPHAEMRLPEAYMEPFINRYPEPNPFPGGHYGAQQHPRAAFAAMVTHMDRDIGRLMQLLKDLGLDENTLVVFTSDNGTHVEGGNDPDFFDSNGPLRGYKRDLYEGGIRVPFIARWKNVIEPGRESNHISAFWDMYPTFCELAGKQPEKNTDGISMVPEFTGKEQPRHDYLYWEFPVLGGRQAVRMGKWKGLRYNLAEGNRNIELYNLDTNPGETRNVAENHPEVLSKISAAMQEAHEPSPVFKLPIDE